MKSDKLQDAVGLVRDDFVKDAEYAVERQAKVYPWLKWAAVAACLGVAVLIAVPALSGKAPEVDPKQNEPVATQPVTATERINEQTAEAIVTEAQKPGWAGDGIWNETREYASYEEFAADIYDPVFEAFAATEESQTHGWSYQVNSTSSTSVGKDGETYEDGTLTQISCSWSNSAEAVLASDAESISIYSYSNDPLLAQTFGVADKEGTSKNYQVDGVEIQKVGGEDTQRTTINGVWHFSEGGGDFSSRTIERVSINGLWYYVDGTDEAEVDAIATTLAHIGATL